MALWGSVRGGLGIRRLRRYNVMVKQNATLDSSFWIHAVAAGLVEQVLEDFDVTVGKAVADELPETYPSGARLQELIRSGRVLVQDPKSTKVDRFGPGERSAMNLAMEHRDWTLFMDDMRPFRAAEELGLSPVSSPAYVASLYSRRVLDRPGALEVLARLAERSTLSPQLIDLALGQVAGIAKERRD